MCPPIGDDATVERRLTDTLNDPKFTDWDRTTFNTFLFPLFGYNGTRCAKLTRALFAQLILYELCFKLFSDAPFLDGALTKYLERTLKLVDDERISYRVIAQDALTADEQFLAVVEELHALDHRAFFRHRGLKNDEPIAVVP